jgi:hypothetical protein
LKMAIGGKRCGTPEEAWHLCLPVGELVKEVRPGVVMSSGLLQVRTCSGSTRLPRVKTVFGGDMWVIRSLTPVEAVGMFRKSWVSSLARTRQNDC